MAISVKYYLESKVKGNDHKALPIFLYIRHKRKTLKVFTERKCARSAWIVANGRANPRKYRGAAELNGFLGELEEEALNHFNYNARKGIITTKEQLIKIINDLSGNAVDDQ